MTGSSAANVASTASTTSLMLARDAHWPSSSSSSPQLDATVSAASSCLSAACCSGVSGMVFLLTSIEFWLPQPVVLLRVEAVQREDVGQCAPGIVGVEQIEVGVVRGVGHAEFADAQHEGPDTFEHFHLLTSGW